MRKIQFETRTHQERSKKIFSLLFIAPPAKFRQLGIIRIPLVKFEIDGTFYIPHCFFITNQSPRPYLTRSLAIQF
jgi:hypothetical protein